MHCRCFNRIRNNRGFTLIEVIVSLVVAAILGTILFTFMSSTLAKSADPIFLAQKGSYLNGIMENMTSDYKLLMATSASPMDTFISNVGAESSEEDHYSDSSHRYTVVANHRISFTPTTGTPVTETPDNAGKILKVTIQYQGLSATALFSE